MDNIFLGWLISTAFNLLGVLLMVWNTATLNPQEYVYQKNITDEMQRKFNRRARLSQLGILFFLGGFLLQLVFFMRGK